MQTMQAMQGMKEMPQRRQGTKPHKASIVSSVSLCNFETLCFCGKQKNIGS
jgi:hypothetical protein